MKNNYQSQVTEVVNTLHEQGMQYIKKVTDWETNYNFELPEADLKLQIRLFNDAEFGNYQVSITSSDKAIATSPFNTIPVKQAIHQMIQSWNQDYTNGLKEVHGMVEKQLRR